VSVDSKVQIEALKKRIEVLTQKRSERRGLGFAVVKMYSDSIEALRKQVEELEKVAGEVVEEEAVGEAVEEAIPLDEAEEEAVEEAPKPAPVKAAAKNTKSKKKK